MRLENRSKERERRGLTAVLGAVLVAILMSRGAAVGPEVAARSRRCGRIGVVGVGAATANRIRGDVVPDVVLIPPVRLRVPEVGGERAWRVGESPSGQAGDTG